MGRPSGETTHPEALVAGSPGTLLRSATSEGVPYRRDDSERPESTRRAGSIVGLGVATAMEVTNRYTE
jgi:hypothetical protein